MDGSNKQSGRNGNESRLRPFSVCARQAYTCAGQASLRCSSDHLNAATWSTFTLAAHCWKALRMVAQHLAFRTESKCPQGQANSIRTLLEVRGQTPPPENRCSCYGCLDCSCCDSRPGRCYRCCSTSRHATPGGAAARWPDGMTTDKAIIVTFCDCALCGSNRVLRTRAAFAAFQIQKTRVQTSEQQRSETIQEQGQTPPPENR